MCEAAPLSKGEIGLSVGGGRVPPGSLSLQLAVDETVTARLWAQGWWPRDGPQSDDTPDQVPSPHAGPQRTLIDTLVSLAPGSLGPLALYP